MPSFREARLVEAVEEPLRLADNNTPAPEPVLPEQILPDRRIRIKNRRFYYLKLHPEYYASESVELADPLLYDKLIRAFQTAQERQREQVSRGFSGCLLHDIERSEAKIRALAHPDPNSPLIITRARDGSIIRVEQDPADCPKTKEEALKQWKEVMGLRFLRGDDFYFDYEEVDENEDYDDRAEEERAIQDRYFDDDEPQQTGGACNGDTGIIDY